MTDNRQNTYTERLGHYIKGVQDGARGHPIIFIDGSQFDTPTPPTKEQLADQVIRNEYYRGVKAHLINEVKKQMEAQRAGSTTEIDDESIYNFAIYAYKEKQAASVQGAIKELGFAIIVLPDPDKFKPENMLNMLGLRGFKVEHFKNASIASDRLQYIVGRHEIEHSFMSMPSRLSIMQYTNEYTQHRLQSEVPADRASYNYLLSAGDIGAAQFYKDATILRARSSAMGDHTTGFFLDKPESFEITLPMAQAIRTLARHMDDLVSNELKITNMQASELSGDNPQKYAIALAKVIKDQKYPKVNKTPMEHMIMDIAEVLGTSEDEARNLISQKSPLAQNAYKKLEKEGKTVTPSIYVTNPHLLEYMNEYIGATRNMFVPDTSPQLDQKRKSRHSSLNVDSQWASVEDDGDGVRANLNLQIIFTSATIPTKPMDRPASIEPETVNYALNPVPQRNA